MDTADSAYATEDKCIVLPIMYSTMLQRLQNRAPKYLVDCCVPVCDVDITWLCRATDEALLVAGPSLSGTWRPGTHCQTILPTRRAVSVTSSECNRMGWTVRYGRPPLLLPSCRKLEFRLSALMYLDLAWVNGKSGRQSWCYADAFQRSIISGSIYHFNVEFQKKLRLTHLQLTKLPQ